MSLTKVSYSMINGAPFNVIDYGADPTGIADSTSAIQNIITQAGEDSCIYFPEGTYKITSTIIISNNRVHLIGAGIKATTIKFAPTANSNCFQVSNSGSVVYQGSIRNMTFNSSDSTYSKTAINLIDVSTYVISDIVIGGSVVVAGGQFWSGGAASVGLQTNGREATSVNNFKCYADKPIVIGTNPNNTISIDHFNFNNCYLSGNNFACVTINSGVNLTQVSFTGYQAWVLGKGGLSWVDTTTAQVSNGLYINNVRYEQCQDASKYFIDIRHNYGMQNLTIKNCYTGGSSGIYLRKCFYTDLQDFVYVDTANEALNIDSTVSYINAINCYWQTGSTASVTGQLIEYASPLHTGPLPFNFQFQPTTDTNRNEIHDGVISSSTISLPINAVAKIGRTDTTAIIVISTNEGANAIYSLNGLIHNTSEIADPFGIFSPTQGTASSLNIYWSAANSQYEIENLRPLVIKVKVVPFGSYTQVD